MVEILFVRFVREKNSHSFSRMDVMYKSRKIRTYCKPFRVPKTVLKFMDEAGHRMEELDKLDGWTVIYKE